MRGAFSIRTKNLLFGYTPLTDDKGQSKIAVSVSKKVARLAVDRNRLKRECRHALRLYIPTLKKPILGIIRVMNKGAEYKDFTAEIKDIFERVAQ